MFSGGKAYYDMKLTDVKTGKTVKKFRKRICHSFVKQFAQLLMQSMSGSDDVPVTDTGNTGRTLAPSYYDHVAFDTGGLATNDTVGSVVGTGTTAVSINDYKLETPIAHGTGSGQLQYGAVSFGAPATDGVPGTNAYTVVTRVFTNGSSGSITVQEIGLYVSFYDTGYQPRFFCIIHDNLASPVAIAAGQALTLNYTIRVTL